MYCFRYILNHRNYIIEQVIRQRLRALNNKAIIATMNTKRLYEILKHKTDLFFALAILIGSGLYMSLIFNNNLWVDEAFTASIIRSPLKELWTRTAADTLPPFYNFFGKLLTSIIGYSAPVMKFGSVIPMIGTLILGACPVRREFGNAVSALFMLFLLSMPNFYYYAVEIRMYSWGIFAVTGAAVYCYRAMMLRTPKDWGKFAFFTVLAGYVHHFAFVSTGMLWLFSLVSILFRSVHKKNDKGSEPFLNGIRPWGVSLFCTFLLYFPCMLLTIHQIKNASSYFSMTPLTIHSFLSDLRFPFVTHYTALSALLLLLAVFAFVSWLFFKEEHSLSGLMFAAVFFATLIFGYSVSLLKGSSMFTARYLVPSLGSFWLGCAVLIVPAIQNMTASEKLRRFCFALIILLVSMTGIVTYCTQFKSEYAKGVDHMTAFFDSELGPDDGYIIYENSYQIEDCFRYYYPDLKKYDWESAGEISGTVWFFAVDGFKKELEESSNFGYNMQYIEHMSFDRYSFDLYRAVPVNH